MMCDICCETKNGKEIICQFCNHKSCVDCAETYILGQPTKAKCMSCKKIWQREFIVKNFSNRFATKDYKKHLENVILDHEKSLLPETQSLAEREKKTREIEAKLAEIAEREAKVNEAIRSANRNVAQTDLWAQKGELREEKEAVLAKQAEHMERQRRGNQQASSSKPIEIVRACPKEECRGFLSKKWSCGMCKCKVCSKCHEIKDEAHECNPDIVKSVQLMAKDSRPCPGCSSMIFKVSGCDQMWCTACKKAFSWRTGEIVENGIIHNPHYFEYVRQNMPGEIEEPIARIYDCNVLPSFDYFQLRIYYERFTQYYRTSGEVEQMRTSYEELTRSNPTQTVRIKYLLGDFDEEKFKIELQKKVKALEKYESILQVTETYCMIVRNLMWRMVPMKTIEEMTPVLDEIEEVRKYINECWKEVGKIYGCKVPEIKDNWTLYQVNQRKHSRFQW